MGSLAWLLASLLGRSFSSQTRSQAWLLLFSDLMHQEERNLSDNGGRGAGFEGREAAQLHAHQAAADSSDDLMGSLATHIDSAAV